MTNQKVFRRGFTAFWHFPNFPKLRVGLKDGVYRFYTIDSFGLLTEVNPERFAQLIEN